MAIKNIDPKASVVGGDSDDDMKPLVRVYGKENPNIYTEVHRVLSGRVSSSGKWVILETENYVVLLSASSSVSKELFNNILPALNGKKANTLVIQPIKKSKVGAIVAVDDEQQCWYSYDDEKNSFETSDQEMETTVKKQEALNVSMFFDMKDGLPSMKEEKGDQLKGKATAKQKATQSVEVR